MRPFEPRRLSVGEIWNIEGWRLKTYSVSVAGEPFDWADFHEGFRLAAATLPSPDPAKGCYGLGFVIAHQGITGDYVVLCWWSQENELPTEVWVRSKGSNAWRAAKQGESFCVWDLEIVWAERQIWVESMMTPSPSPERYLSRVLEEAA